MKTKTKIETIFKQHKTIFLFIFGVWFVFFIVVLGFTYTDFKATLLNFGVFGDSFNVITSLFTGLAFAGVIVSVILQTQELTETRKELAKQAKHLANQAKHLEKQQQEMVSQSFDNKFFQMLNMFNANVENFSVGVKVGKDVIRVIMVKFIDSGEMSFNDSFANLIVGGRSVIVKPYCISLYQVLKYVDNDAPKNETKRYTNIIRAQLSADELALLLYNAIGVIPSSGNKYKELLEKYAFFEHLSVEYLNRHQSKFVDYVLKQYDKKVAGKNTELADKIESLQKTVA